MKSYLPASFTRRSVLKGVSGLALSAAAGTAMAPVAARAQDAGTVRVLAVEDPFFFSLQAVLPDFEAETGIRVELESLSYDALQARLVSSFVANTSDADVVTVDQMWLGQYLDNGWITPLDDFIAGDADLDLDDFIPEVLYSSNIWKGQVGTLPIAAYAQGVMYRTDILEALGIDAPPVGTSEDWTWEAYLDILRRIEGEEIDGRRIYPTVVCGAQPGPIVHMFTQLTASHGADWFTSFPGAPWDFEPTIGGEAWERSVEIYRELYRLSPPESINYVWFDAGTRFSAGDIAMFYWWTPYFYLIKNNGYMTGVASEIMDSYATAALPKAPGVEQTISIGGWSLGVPSSSANQEAGYAFVKWATSAATQKKMALWPDLNHQFSDFARESLYRDEEVRAVYPYLDVQRDMMSQGNGKVTRPPVPGYTALESILGLHLNQLISGEGEIAPALQTTNDLFASVLRGNLLIPYQQESVDDTLDAARALLASLSS